MKALILLFSFVSILCFISCGKTDSDSKPEPTTTPTANTPTATTPTATTPTATTPTAGKQKYSSPSGQGRHPPLVCNIHNYKDFIKKPGDHHCNLEGANLKHANLVFTNLTGANLRGADLRYADLREADLRGARLAQVKWEGAKLTGAKVTPLQAVSLIGQGFKGFVIKK